MSYAIPLPARPRLDFYKKLAKELLRASSDASKEDAVRAWAVLWLESFGWFSEATQPTGVFPEQRSPVEMRGVGGEPLARATEEDGFSRAAAGRCAVLSGARAWIFKLAEVC